MRSSHLAWSIAAGSVASTLLIAFLLFGTHKSHPPDKRSSRAHSGSHSARDSADGPADKSSRGASHARTPAGSDESGDTAHATGAQRVAEVQNLLDDGADPRGLASVIAEWANEPDALPARRMALEALRGTQPKAVRLDALRNAAASSDALSKDPLAPEMISAATEALELKDFPAARDMMIAASNARARELLASSLAKYVSSDRGMAELSPTDMTGIRSDFIDVYGSLPEMQRKDVEAAVEKIAGGAASQLLRDIPPAPSP